MKKRILFIDDEPKVLFGLNRMLHRQSAVWDMAFLTSANEAKRLLTERPFDAVLLDIEMPGKSGFELLSEIKRDSRTKNTEVIVLTGIYDHTLKRKALDLGATDLLNKPVQIEDLIARLNSALQLKAFQDELKSQNALLERELIKSQKMELAGILATGAIQDLRNILLELLGQSGLAARQLSQDSPVLKNMRSIADTAGQAQRIVTQILNVTQIKEQKRKSCDLGEIIDEILRLLSLSIPDDVEVEWKRPKSYPEIVGVPTQIYQLILNICLNSLQSMEHEGKLSIELKSKNISFNEGISVAIDTADRNCLELKISHTGCELRPNALFGDSKDVESPLDEICSNGLGLCVARLIVEGHGGKIVAKNDNGYGTVFMIDFPVLTGDEYAAGGLKEYMWEKQ